MSRATVTRPYSSHTTHTAITSAVYKLKQTFALIDLLGPFIPFLFCFLLLPLMFSFEGLVHLATMHSSAWPQGMCPWDIGWSCLDLRHCALPQSHPSESVFPRVLPVREFLSSEIHCSKQNEWDICSLYLPSPHLFLHSSVFSGNVVCLSFHTECEREISLFLT